MNESLAHIKVEWSGAYSQEEIRNSINETDYGLYQVYGNHRIYGKDVLLYIGRAVSQSFGHRIPQHTDWFDWKDAELKFYLGKIIESTDITAGYWDSQIMCSEIALINHCQPAWNSANLNRDTSQSHLKDFILYNYGDIRSLPKILKSDNNLTNREDFNTKSDLSAVSNKKMLPS